MRPIVIDPGHCAEWPGARGRVLGVREHIVALQVAQMTAAYLMTRGVTALLTHEDTHGLSRISRVSDLIARRDFALTRRLPILSIHCNSAEDPRANGYECWTTQGKDASDLFATSLLCHYAEVFPRQRMRADRRDGDPDKEAGFAVLRKNVGALFELPFLSNPGEERWLGDSGNYPAIARALGDGCIAWLEGVQL